MEAELYLKARAKINLSLEIVKKREDNYHDIKSVFQKINLYDDIFLKKDNTFSLTTNIEELNNEENIIYKAYKLLKNRFPFIKGVSVKLYKRIPTQAGLGGGSTDCASFLVGMNKLYNLKMTDKELEEIGSILGADVVPCLYDGALLVEGIGNIVTPINTNFEYYILIVKPSISCSTKEMYKKIDENNVFSCSEKSNKIIKALETNNLELLSGNLYNDFEYVINDENIINNIKKDLINNGAVGSLLTGSGSCVFGLFHNKREAEIAYSKLKQNYEVYICNSHNFKI